MSTCTVVLLLLLAAEAAASLFAVRAYKRACNRQLYDGETTGTVIKSVTNQYQGLRITVRYTVSDTDYTLSFTSNSRITQLQECDQVPVFYSTLHPKRSFTPEDTVMETRKAIPLILCLLLTVMTCIAADGWLELFLPDGKELFFAKLASYVLIVLTILSVGAWWIWQQRKLRKYAVSVQGKVIESKKVPLNKKVTHLVSYTVQDRTYEISFDQPVHRKKKAELLQTGDTVELLYRTDKPFLARPAGQKTMGDKETVCLLLLLLWKIGWKIAELFIK